MWLVVVGLLLPGGSQLSGIWRLKKKSQQGSDSLISGGSVVGGGGGQPLLAGEGTSGVTGEKGTMSNTSVDCGLMEMLPACARGQWKCLRP